MPGSTSNIRAGRAFVEIGTDNNPLSAGLAKAQKQLQAFGNAIASIGAKLVALGTSIVAPIVAAAVAFADYGNGLAKASERTGIAVETLSELGYAARQSATDMESLETGVRKMQRTIVDAAEGVGKSVDALRELGLTVSDLKNRTADQQMKVIADRLKDIKDPALAADAAMKIFGKGGVSLLPLLQQGSAGMNAWQERARALGLTMSTESAKSAEVFHDRLEDLKEVLQNGVQRAGIAVLPILQRFVTAVTDGAVRVARWVSEHQELVRTALRIGVGITAAGVAMLALAGVVSVVSTALGGVAAIISLVVGGVSMLAGVLTSIVPVAIAGVIAGIVGLAAYFGYASDVGKYMVDALSGYFGELKATAVSTFKGVTDAISAGDWGLAAKVAMAGVKLAFAEAVGPLKNYWYEVKNVVLNVWENITNAVAKAKVKLMSWFDELWQKAKSTYAQIAQSIRSGAEQETIDKTLQASLGDINGREKAGKLSRDQANKERQAALDFFNERSIANEKAFAAGINAAEAELRTKLATIDTEEKATLKALETAHNQELQNNKDASDDDVARAQADLEAKKAALKALTAQAKEEAKKTAANAVAPPKRPNIPSAEDLQGGLDGLDRKIQVRGSFNSDARQFGRGTDAKAAAEKKANDILKKQVDLLQQIKAAIQNSFKFA